MTRLLIVFGFIFALAYLGTLIADYAGVVNIDLGDRVISTSLTTILGLSALMIFTAIAGTALIAWIINDATFVGRQSAVRRQGRGFAKLNSALVAMAAGDHRMASKLVGEAEVLLPPQPMVHLLAAETALRDGETETARKRYEALEGMEDGRFLGLRGLVQTARQMGREAEALTLARAASDDRPNSPWVLDTLFSLEVTAGHWAEAGQVLDRMAKRGLKDADRVASHKGALAFGEAVEAGLSGDHQQARKLYRQALKVRPGFAPATAALARLEQAAGRRKAAEKLILNAWAEAPFPSLRSAYKSLDVTENRADWLKRARRLAETNPDHRASLLLVADAALKAEDLETANSVLSRLTGQKPDREILQARLTYARQKGEPLETIEQQLSHARLGPGWSCRSCYHPANAWVPLCPHCGAFDSLDWQEDGAPSAPLAAPQTDGLMLMTNAPIGPALIEEAQNST